MANTPPAGMPKEEVSKMIDDKVKESRDYFYQVFESKFKNETRRIENIIN